MHEHYARNGPRDSDARHEKQLRQDAEDPEVDYAQHPAHVHRALKESLFALEAVPTHGTRFVHAEASREHPPAQARRAALFEDRLETG